MNSLSKIFLAGCLAFSFSASADRSRIECRFTVESQAPDFHLRPFQMRPVGDWSVRLLRDSEGLAPEDVANLPIAFNGVQVTLAKASLALSRSVVRVPGYARWAYTHDTDKRARRKSEGEANPHFSLMRPIAENELGVTLVPKMLAMHRELLDAIRLDDILRLRWNQSPKADANGDAPAIMNRTYSGRTIRQVSDDAKENNQATVSVEIPNTPGKPPLWKVVLKMRRKGFAPEFKDMRESVVRELEGIEARLTSNGSLVAPRITQVALSSLPRHYQRTRSSDYTRLRFEVVLPQDSLETREFIHEFLNAFVLSEEPN